MCRAYAASPELGPSFEGTAGPSFASLFTQPVCSPLLLPWDGPLGLTCSAQAPWGQGGFSLGLLNGADGVLPPPGWDKAPSEWAKAGTPRVVVNRLALALEVQV